MVKTLFNTVDEPVDCDFDKLQLIYKENEYISHYAFKEDIEDASDYFQKTVRINDENISVDCEIAELIDRLNNKSSNPHNSTRYCCSSHYMNVTWLYDKPSDLYNESKATVICSPSSYKVTSGYILFNSIHDELEKIVPLRKKNRTVDQITDIVLKSKKPFIDTQRFDNCTGLYWWAYDSKNVARETVEYITKLIEPIL